eukprot:4797425-Pyramimonas_sp.AAC.1
MLRVQCNFSAGPTIGDTCRAALMAQYVINLSKTVIVYVCHWWYAQTTIGDFPASRLVEIGVGHHGAASNTSFNLKLELKLKLPGDWGNRGADPGGTARGVFHCPAL